MGTEAAGDTADRELTRYSELDKKELLTTYHSSVSKKRKSILSTDPNGTWIVHSQ